MLNPVLFYITLLHCKPMKYILTSLALILSFGFTNTNPDAILGVWQNGSGKGHIHIYKQSGKYFGKIVWLKSPMGDDGRPRVDKKNQDESMRTKPLIGAIMLRDFAYEDGEWNGGRIYNPEDGKEYKAYMKMKDRSTLTVRGYVGFSWIGKTDIWQRVK